MAGHRRNLSRRRFLQVSAGASGAYLIAACGNDDADVATATATATSEPTATAAATPEPTAAAASPTLAEKAGQMVMAGFRGLDVAEDDAFARQLQQANFGGAILFSYDVPSSSPVRNVESPEQVQALVAQLQALAPTPLLVAVDQEGGFVARLEEDHGFPATRSAQELASVGDLAETRRSAGEMAQTLAAMGISINLAPVVDVNVNPENPVIGAIERSFSADPALVIEQAAAFIEGHHEHGVLTSLKHFPGHGSSTADSHLGFVDVTDTWTAAELEPFAALIDLGLADSVMTAHIVNAERDPTYPATLSQPTIQGVLRDELGFDGVVFSDDIQMGAITDNFGSEEAIGLAIAAGVDMLIVGNNLDYEESAPVRTVDTIVRLVEEGTLPMARIDESYARIQRLKERMLAPA